MKAIKIITLGSILSVCGSQSSYATEAEANKLGAELNNVYVSLSNAQKRGNPMPEGWGEASRLYTAALAACKKGGVPTKDAECVDALKAALASAKAVAQAYDRSVGATQAGRQSGAKLGKGGAPKIAVVSKERKPAVPPTLAKQGGGQAGQDVVVADKALSESEKKIWAVQDAAQLMEILKQVRSRMNPGAGAEGSLIYKYGIKCNNRTKLSDLEACKTDLIIAWRDMKAKGQLKAAL